MQSRLISPAWSGR